MSGLAKMLALVFLGWVVWGCGGGAPDSEDELGHQEDEGRYELVFLDRPETGIEEETPDSTSELPSGKASGSRVEPAVEAPEPVDTSTPGLPVVFEPQGEYTVQVGSFQDARLAARAASELRAVGYPAYTVASPGKGVRVRIGYFKTSADAQRFGEMFKADQGLKFWVDRRVDE